MSQWYAIRTATRQEFKAQEGLREQGFVVYLPCETLIRRLGGAKEPVRRPLFVGYMFVHCEPQSWSVVRDTQYVHEFVKVMTGQGAQPAPFPTFVIAEVFWQELTGAFDRTKSPAAWRPARGDKATVVGGKWGAMNYIGTILSLTTNGRRALISVEKGFKVEVDVEHLTEAA